MAEHSSAVNVPVSVVEDTMAGLLIALIPLARWYVSDAVSDQQRDNLRELVGEQKFVDLVGMLNDLSCAQLM